MNEEEFVDLSFHLLWFARAFSVNFQPHYVISFMQQL
jgi:hypothetical protein